MKWRIVRILVDGVPLEEQTIDRLGIEQGIVEGLEHIILNADSMFFSTMKEGFLGIQIWYFRLNGDDGTGKLKHIGKRIHETILADNDIAAGTRLIPPVAVTTKQYGCT